MLLATNFAWVSFSSAEEIIDEVESCFFISAAGGAFGLIDTGRECGAGIAAELGLGSVIEECWERR